MNKQKEALQLALEAFEESGILWKMDKAHKAVKEALKEPSWIELTDEDKQIAFDDTQEGGGFWEFADAIETKLKEKNT